MAAYDIHVQIYHAGLPAADRKQIQDSFMHSEGVVVATIACVTLSSVGLKECESDPLFLSFFWASDSEWVSTRPTLPRLLMSKSLRYVAPAFHPLILALGSELTLLRH